LSGASGLPRICELGLFELRVNCRRAFHSARGIRKVNAQHEKQGFEAFSAGFGRTWEVSFGADVRIPIESVPQPSEREAPTCEAWRSRHTPQQFDAVVGQNEVVRALSPRIRTNKRSGHVVLYGPPGVGKLTVARIYRRALHCESPTASGSACLSCENCRELSGSWAAQLIDIDARDHGGVESARYLVETVRDGFSSDKERVIIVRNVEAFEDAATGALLKVLEFDAAHTIFVTTTTNIDTLRSPVRSRCQAYRLRPLSKTQAKERLIQLCEQENVVYDPVALEIMAAHAGNRAGDLLHCLCKVASGGAVTVARVEEIFGLKWTDAMLNYWRSLLARNEKESLKRLRGCWRERRRPDRALEGVRPPARGGWKSPDGVHQWS